MIRLVQIGLRSDLAVRRVACVEANRLRVLNGYASVYACAAAALEGVQPLAALVAQAGSSEALDYDAVYGGHSEWKLLPAFDHPGEPTRCLVSGTGLTHRKSAATRNAMHVGPAGQDAPQAAPPEAATITDSMRIYAWGEQGGRPAPGEIGAQPEWFYKGNGTILRGHGDSLDVPAYAEDGGEEAEVAGIYLVDKEGEAWRVGFAQGNEFSDHRMEARNYLYLAPSKLRACALGPELLLPEPGEDLFDDVQGRALVERNGEVVWKQEIASGNANMVHTLANLEHHHFKYAAHRRPGDAHVHFFGTGGFSFGSGVRLQDGDMMTVTFEGYGRPLRNPLRMDSSTPALQTVRAL